MGEKNILAYFKSPEEAQGAARKLEALRVTDMSIDRFSRYPRQSTGNAGLPVFSGQINSLSSLTQGVEFTDRSPAILAAADPVASGMSDGGQGGPTGRDILLTAVVDESIHHQAMSIVEQAGGML
ncbi:hypothetical protein L8C07_02375 [Paenibacillus sp. CMAA1739]|uniref:Uncharacterized protein n=1 Tax=Paenibacillus ottowii TaxID=2315729 RepID=A0ABY3B0N7_9BACL|nr:MULTISPECIES: hypothetical protein [Paenibacillus]KZE72968.1 hypothetical protein AV545_01035 [Paenibacillus jamilae]MDP1509099.1 hypothetical protein [Paenibacillus ottowii]MEC4564776.1 hypothetical protein [Paenibacillus sp. CMAA1739]NEU26255.1 hypothetical protein [Paenibacillus polymyxa]OBA06452.1 hypothetical protein A9P44_11555 [Paenibacillus polymyxa]